MNETPTRPLAIAISGGGHRATLYALGSFMALVDRGLNRDIVQISSVSGGSILNGVLAHNKLDAATLSYRDVDAIAQEITHVAVRKGVLGWPWIVGMLITCGVLAVTVGSVAFLSSAALWLGCLVALLSFAVPLLGGGHLLSWRLRATYFRNSPRSRLRDLPPSSVDHVFCTTDLASGYPAYFTTAGTGRMWWRDYDLGTGGGGGFLYEACEFNLPQVVRASAGFPGVPPMLLRLRHLKLLEQKDIVYNWGLPKRGRKLFLSDGGISNNLATQALRDDKLFQGQQLFGRERLREPKTLLCVNASAPMSPRSGWPFFLPGLAQLTQVNRCLQILSFNTVAPRIASMHAILNIRARSRLFEENIDLVVNLSEHSRETLVGGALSPIVFERSDVPSLNQARREWEDELLERAKYWILHKEPGETPEEVAKLLLARDWLEGNHPPPDATIAEAGFIDRKVAHDLLETEFWKGLEAIESEKGSHRIGTTLGRIADQPARFLIARGYMHTFVASLAIRPFQPSDIGSADWELITCQQTPHGSRDPASRIRKFVDGNRPANRRR